MLLHRGADIRSSCDFCDVTFQDRVVCAHGEETPHHHEAVAAAQMAQHTLRADSVSTVFSVLMSNTVMVPPCTSPPTVMEIIPHRTMSLIAASMIAFIVATTPPPPLAVALADDASGGIVPPLSSSSLR